MVNLKNNKTLSTKDLESKTIRPLFIIYEAVEKVLRENGIIKGESEEEKKKMECVFGAMMKLQTSFITQNKQNQYDIKANISSIKEEIEKSLGAVVS